MPKQQKKPDPPSSPVPENLSGGSPSEEYLRETANIPDQILDDDAPADKQEQQSVEQFPPELVQQALRPTFNAIFNAVASKRGEHWKLEKFEEDGLVIGWTPIIQHLLAKLGSSEQTMLILAVGSTAAIVGGKVAQDVSKRASSTASTRTPGSGGSSASSASVEAVKQPAPAQWSPEHVGA